MSMRQRYYIKPASGLLRRERIKSRTHRLFSNFAPACKKREHCIILVITLRVHLYCHGGIWREFFAAAIERVLAKGTSIGR